MDGGRGNVISAPPFGLFPPLTAPGRDAGTEAEVGEWSREPLPGGKEPTLAMEGAWGDSDSDDEETSGGGEFEPPARAAGGVSAGIAPPPGPGSLGPAPAGEETGGFHQPLDPSVLAPGTFLPSPVKSPRRLAAAITMRELKSDPG